jgi:hypothetical protein
MIWMMLLAGLAAQDDPATTAHAEADALIAAADAEGVFENITADSVPTLRHIQSGLTCHFTPGEASNSVTVYPDMGAGLARGDNVACNTRASRMNATLYATRYAGQVTDEQVMEISRAAILTRLPDARPYEGGFPLLTAPTRDEPPLHAVFTDQNAEGPFVTFLLIQHHGAWGFKFRGSREGDDVVEAGMTGGMMFMNALGDVGGEP